MSDDRFAAYTRNVLAGAFRDWTASAPRRGRGRGRGAASGRGRGAVSGRGVPSGPGRGAAPAVSGPVGVESARAQQPLSRKARWRANRERRLREEGVAAYLQQQGAAPSSRASSPPGSRSGSATVSGSVSGSAPLSPPAPVAAEDEASTPTPPLSFPTYPVEGLRMEGLEEGASGWAEEADDKTE